MSLKGTKTAENLLKSYAGEMQANGRYNQFAKIAKKEGYVQIERIFAETANQEVEHAKVFYKYLAKEFHNEHIEITASYPVELGTTEENLIAAAAGEKEEWSDLYPTFRDIAKEEGFDEIAHSFQEISEVEENHEERYLKLLKNLQEGKVFKRDVEEKWYCQNCGYIHTGFEAPEECPACKHKREYFKLFREDY